MFDIDQDEEKTGTSGFIDPKFEHHPVIKQEKQGQQKKRKTKVKKRKTFHDTLQKLKQNNLLWERHADTSAYMSFFSHK